MDLPRYGLVTFTWGNVSAIDQMCIRDRAETWQDAVKIGVDLLVAADVVEPRYRCV